MLTAAQLDAPVLYGLRRAHLQILTDSCAGSSFAPVDAVGDDLRWLGQCMDFAPTLKCHGGARACQKFGVERLDQGERFQAH